MRKAHSLIAGLGRWEQPRSIKIFDQIPGTPKRYRMADTVWVLPSEEIDDRESKAGK
jgi:hypothetical protein